MTRSLLLTGVVSALCIACSGTGSRNDDRTVDSSQPGAAVARDTARPNPPPPDPGINKPAAARGPPTRARDSIIGRDSAIEWPKGGKPGRSLPTAKRD